MHLAKYRALIKLIMVPTVAIGLGTSAPSVAAAQEEAQDILPLLPAKREYTPGMQIPPEYRVVEGPRKPLLISGAAAFGVSYLSMVGLGIYALATTNEQSGASMLIPVISPFGWAFAPFGTSGFNSIHAAFLVDGVLQVAGIGLLIAGAATPGKYLERKDIASAIPSVSVGPRSVGFQWTF